MRQIRLHIALLVLLVSTLSLFGQNGNITKANKLYQDLSYVEAAKYFEKGLKKEFYPTPAKRLALCYMKTREYRKAESWFAKLIVLPDISKEVVFMYARVLMINEKYMQAKHWFGKYKLQNREDLRTDQFIAICDSIEYFKRRPAPFRLENVKINSKQADFAPMYYKDGFVFSSSRVNSAFVSEKYEWDGNPFLDMYYCELRDSGTKIMRPKILKGGVSSNFHEGTSSFCPKDSLFYFTRNSYSDKKLAESGKGEVNLKIYYGRLGNKGWKNLKELPFNSNEFSVGHPSITKDGSTLYFVSDMAGGFGGTDLWRAVKKEEGWGRPQNLGAEINTTGNEMFPFIHRDNVLYFSSDGHPGLGGMDIFSAQVQGKGRQLRHLGWPINSSYDDFSYILTDDRKSGYFSSDRPGGKGDDDLYSFTATYPEPKCRPQKENNYCFTFFEQSSSSEMVEGTGYTYEWDLGDGNKKRGLEVDHCYTKPGSYLVKLNVVDSLSGFVFITESEYELLLEDIPQVYIESPETLLVGKEIVFDGGKSVLNGCDIKDYQWDFGKGFSRKSKRASYRYRQPGKYTVRLRVNGNATKGDDLYCSSCVTKQVVVVLPEGMDSIMANREEVISHDDIPAIDIEKKLSEIECVEQADNFCYVFYETGTQEIETDGLSYEWDMGDGTKIRSLEAVHCFPGLGRYTVMLNIVDTISGFISRNQAIYEFVLDNPNGAYIDAPDTGFVEIGHVFDANLSTVEDCKIHSYQWFFSSGEAYQGDTFTHYFNSPGVYTVNLEIDGASNVPGSACRQCVSKTIQVFADSLAPPELLVLRRNETEEQKDRARNNRNHTHIDEGIGVDEKIEEEDNPVSDILDSLENEGNEQITVNQYDPNKEDLEDMNDDPDPNPKMNDQDKKGEVIYTGTWNTNINNNSKELEKKDTIEVEEDQSELVLENEVDQEDDSIAEKKLEGNENENEVSGHNEQRLDNHLQGQILNKGNKSITDFFEENPDWFLLNGKVTSLEGDLLEGAKIKIHLLHKDSGKDEILEPDDAESFFLGLKPDAEFIVIVEKPGYLTLRQHLNTIGKNNGDLLNISFELEKAALNKVFVLHNVYYDLGSSNIRPDAARVLVSWAEFLKDNPGISIELSSHTDSRGNDQLNLRLSQKRAEAASKFLSVFDVSPDRLVAVGYGEQKLINKCINGENCSEAEHQLNRRTEFRIVGLDEELAKRVQYDPGDFSNLGDIYAVLEDQAEEEKVDVEAEDGRDEIVEGTTFRVQIGLFRGANQGLFYYNLREYYRDLKIDREGEFKRSTVGSFDTYNDALKLAGILKLRGYKDAFVVTYVDNKRVH